MEDKVTDIGAEIPGSSAPGVEANSTKKEAAWEASQLPLGLGHVPLMPRLLHLGSLVYLCSE
jgi:hypothetical protein